MWRAYGGNTNVSLTFNCLDLFEKENKLKIFASPVMYGDKDFVDGIFREIFCLLDKEIDKIKIFDPNKIFSAIIAKFHSADLSIKHPGFKEEKEWRIIYSPTIQNDINIVEDTKIINGIPQIIMKLNIQDAIDQSESKLEISDLMHEVMIGPTNHADIIAHAIANALKSWGIKDPYKKIKFSDIPLRR